MSTIIIYGPQGCGKTRNAQVIAKHFKLSKIVEGWNGVDELEDGTLALTNVPNIAGAINFEETMKQISLA